MGSIPSIEDIYIIILLVFPGFLSFLLFRYIAILEKKVSDSEKIIWSVSLSIVTYTIIFSFIDQMSYEIMQTRIYDPTFLMMIMGTSTVVGLFLGGIVRLIRGGKIYPDDCWMLFQRKISKKSPWVIVHTKDGKEYKGKLHYVGRLESDKELIIRNPSLIIRKDQWEVVSEHKLKGEMFFAKDTIARIYFFEHF